MEAPHSYDRDTDLFWRTETYAYYGHMDFKLSTMHHQHHSIFLDNHFI